MTLSIITGANRGIGLALTRALKDRGGDVIAACRKSSAELEALDVEIAHGVDVTDAQGVEKLAVTVGSRPIDLLINNAGILIFGDTLEKPKFDEILQQFKVNAMGPVRVTSALQRNLKQGSKVAFITSRMGSITDNTSGGVYGYRMSKAALNIAAVSIGCDLREAGVAVIILHPGMVNTEMVGGQGKLEPSAAAAGLLERIDQLTLDSTGSFLHQTGEILPW